jgi:hypothetical protein
MKSWRSKMRFKAHRTTAGQLMGVADLIIVIPATILCFFFLTNTGLSVYYKNRIGQTAHEAVVYAATHLGSQDVDLDTQVFAGDLFHKMNIPASNITAKVEKITLGGVPAVQCNLHADFDLLQGSPLPYKISLTEISCTADTAVAQVAVKAIVNGSMHTVYLPVIHRLENTPVIFNPRLFMTDQGASSYLGGAPDL